jgi:cation diffusion facilitator CzcD-associated flavoprotein CzcO
MRRKFFILHNAAAADGGTAKPSQADVIAQNAQLKADKDLLTAQLAQANATNAQLVLDKTQLQTQLTQAQTATTNANASVNTLTGDRTKLQTGAELPTDLVSAANTILTLRAEVTQLKAEKATVASQVARLGIHGGTATAAAGNTTGTEAAKAPAWNPDAAILAARGVKSLDELNAQYKDGVKIA